MTRRRRANVSENRPTAYDAVAALWDIRHALDPDKPERLMLTELPAAIEHLRRDADEAAANLIQWLATGSPAAYAILRTFAKRQGYGLPAEDPVVKLRETVQALPKSKDGFSLVPGMFAVLNGSDMSGEIECDRDATIISVCREYVWVMVDGWDADACWPVSGIMAGEY